MPQNFEEASFSINQQKNGEKTGMELWPHFPFNFNLSTLIGLSSHFGNLFRLIYSKEYR